MAQEGEEGKEKEKEVSASLLTSIFFIYFTKT